MAAVPYNTSGVSKATSTIKGDACRFFYGIIQALRKPEQAPSAMTRGSGINKNNHHGGNNQNSPVEMNHDGNIATTRTAPSR